MSPIPINLAVEDALSEAVLRQLLVTTQVGLGKMPRPDHTTPGM